MTKKVSDCLEHRGSYLSIISANPVNTVIQAGFFASNSTSCASPDLVTLNFLSVVWYKPRIHQVRSSYTPTSQLMMTRRDRKREHHCDITSMRFHGRRQNENANVRHKTHCGGGLSSPDQYLVFNTL